MPDIITLSCPFCGHKLQITPEIDRFACAACGNEHIVNRSGGMITIKPVIESIRNLQIGVDKTASELAIVRLRNEIAALEERVSTLHAAKASRTESGMASGGTIPVTATTCLMYILGLATLIFFGTAIGLASVKEFDFTDDANKNLIRGVVSLILLLVFIYTSRTKIKNEREALINKRNEVNRELDQELRQVTNLLNSKKNELRDHQIRVSQ